MHFCTVLPLARGGTCPPKRVRIFAEAAELLAELNNEANRVRLRPAPTPK